VRTDAGARTRNVILTGGHTHAFATSAPALAALLRDHGIESTIDDDPERALVTLESTRAELLTVYALRWTMRTGDKYGPFRERWGFSLSAQGRAAIEAHLARGGGLLALHTAIICFDAWPQWRDILGGRWEWGRSSHPPFGPVAARIDDAAHPLVRGLSGFSLDDEAYGDLDMTADVHPLLSVRAAGGAWQPALWTRTVGHGRVVVDTLGHDEGAFTHPVHRRIVGRAALWALERDEATVIAA
jgi:type 1 glutamine amidotransferase